MLNAQLLQSCSNFCDPVDCSPPGSSVHGILQARILEWVAISFSRDLPNPEIEPMSPASPASPASQEDSLPSEPPGKPINVKHLVLKYFFKASSLVLKSYVTVSKIKYLHARTEANKTPKIEVIKEVQLLNELILQTTYSTAFSTIL